ncbi:hypothetical protein ABQ397_24295 [Serratia fonticola]|uniref:hypothetical protein n=1 Tax=Serratia fonticola TaxID=47917 RepID=UPI003AAD73F8
MTDDRFKMISLHPEDAIINIDALVNAALFLNMVNEQGALAEVLTVASDYLAEIRKAQSGVMKRAVKKTLI